MLRIYLAARHYYDQVAAIRILILQIVMELRKFTFTENQIFLRNFYTTKIWSHTVSVTLSAIIYATSHFDSYQKQN